MLIVRWKSGIKANGLRINMGKIKAIGCQIDSGEVEELEEYLCGIYVDRISKHILN